jgi:hypothetical protein
MRISLSSITIAFVILSSASYTLAQTTTLTENLSLGASGAQVTILQKILNKDPETRIADTGPGSPGNETGHFGLLTKTAVMRFQQKYAADILVPGNLARGNGYVGFFTRTKLNLIALSSGTASAVKPVITPSTPTTTPPATPQVTDYQVKDTEKIDIYAGDSMIAAARSKILSALNAAFTSGSTGTIQIPTIKPSEVPNVAIGTLTPRSGPPGTSVTVTGSGILSNSTARLGNAYIVRSTSRNLSGTFSFIIPPIPAMRYDIALTTGTSVSNTVPFVVTDPKNPTVHIQGISPETIPYGGTITITGSGFTAQGNTVVTTFQKFANVASPDGKTISVQVSPDNLTESARVGNGSVKVPMTIYIVNDYGFSDSEKSFTMTL